LKISTTGILKLFNESPLLRMVVGRIGHDVSVVRWRVVAPSSNGNGKAVREVKAMPYKDRDEAIAFYKQTGELRDVDSHPFLDLLINGNDFLLGSTVRKLTTIYIDLVGEAFWILERNMVGAPIAAIPIPPSWVIATPTSRNPFFVISTGQLRLDVPDEEMIWFVDPDITNPYARGSGIGHTLTDEIEIEEYSAKHVKSFFSNRARPEILITGPGLNTESTKRVEENWLAKLHFESMQMVDLRKHERDVIINTYGVSPEVFGIIEDANRSTIDASDFLVAKHVTVPRLEFLREYFQFRVLPLYGAENLVITYDSPIDEDRDRKLRAARFAPWAMLVNEWRELQGLDPLPYGDVHMVNTSIFPHETLAEGEFEPPPVAGDARESSEAAKNVRR
jgi:hypothetical protein